MTRLLICAVVPAAMTLAGCQSTAVAPASSKDPRFDRFCHDRPFEAGICDQPNNWRLFAPAAYDR